MLFVTFKWRTVKHVVLFAVLLCLLYYMFTLYYLHDIIYAPPSSSSSEPKIEHKAAPIRASLGTHHDHHPVQELNENDIDASESATNIEYCSKYGYYNRHQFSRHELDALIQQRVTAPTKICNEHDVANRKTHWKRLETSMLPHNLVPFVNRCKLNIFRDNAEFTELWSNNQTTYNHVYKCGGTTIWNALEHLQKHGKMNGIGIKYKLDKNDSFLLKENAYYWDHEQYFYNYFNRNFYFSYVRNPIDRALSSYYEVAVKDTKMLNLIYEVEQLPAGANLTGTAGYRSLMAHLLNWKCEHLNVYQDIEKRREQHVNRVWTGDPHVHPQMIHLLNRTFQWFPYDYIGDLTMDFNDSFRMILDEFSDDVHADPSLYDKYVKRARNRQSGTYGAVLKKGVIRREDLTASDIQTICEIYWVDYLCLPFEVPKECNITDLFVRHYYEDVTYMDCYYI